MTDAQRIPALPREEWTEAARDVFAFWEGPAARETGSSSSPMMMLANHPKLALASLEFGKYVLVKSLLTKRQRELVVLRVAWRFRSQYQWAHHVETARKLGMSEVELAALRSAEGSPVWDRADRALLQAIDQLCDEGRIDDSVWAVLGETMDRQQLMDFVYSVGFFAMNAWAFGAMGVQLEPDFTCDSLMSLA